MKPYRDFQGDSGISAYESGGDWIDIQFKGGNTYRYRAAEVGAAAIRTMKRLAETGDGLNTYINTHPAVKNGYLEKW